METPTRHGRLTLLLAALLLYPLGCTNGSKPDAPSGAAPLIRVRIHTGVDSVTLACGVPPLYQLSNQTTAQHLNSPNNAVFTLALTDKGWQAGNSSLGGTRGTTLYMQPDREGSVSINGVNYRGKFRFIPVGNGKFDVCNDLDIDGYLAGVVAKECLPGWLEETYKAQAVVARTYALYEKQTAGLDRYWDVYPDTKSQVYGGIPGETAKSRLAVAETAGVVVAHPDNAGNPKIFKAYFSACCGGISQAATEAFGDPYIPPLSDQDVQSACRASPRFNWGPIVVDKQELGRRFVEFGKRRDRGEKNMGPLARIDIQAQNRFGRPVRFLIQDTRGNKFSLSGEEFRWAVNTNAPEATQLLSSFVKIINDSDKVRFVEGHGWGHGVGMCQWCAESRAEAGLRHEDIVLAAFPTGVLVRAY